MSQGDAVTGRPGARAVASRAIALRHVAVYAYRTPPRPMLEPMLARWSEAERAQYGAQAEPERLDFWSKLDELEAPLSPWEQKFAKSTKLSMSVQQQVAAVWRPESLQVLLWALGLVPDMLAYDDQAGDRPLKTLPGAALNEALATAKLRSAEAIDNARDTASLWHWRARTWQLVRNGRPFPGNAQTRAAGFHSFDDVVRSTAKGAAEERIIPPLIDEDFPAFGKSYRSLSEEEYWAARSIAQERHFALNWLTGHAPGNRWDETRCDP
jgi:hypothetical protein